MEKSVHAFMKTNPAVIASGSSLGDAINLMDEGKENHLIVTEKNRIKGIISKSDILDQLKSLIRGSGGKTYNSMILDSMKVDEFMTPNPVCINPEASLDEAVNILCENNFHILPVGNTQNELVGVISTGDLLTGLLINRK